MKPRKQFLQKLDAIIQANLADPEFNGTTLAAHLSLSRMQLYRYLKRYLGVSANKVILNARMTKAKELLQKPGLSIATVARLCGYQDPAYFSRVFRKTYDTAPSRFNKVEKEE